MNKAAIGDGWAPLEDLRPISSEIPSAPRFVYIGEDGNIRAMCDNGVNYVLVSGQWSEQEPLRTRGHQLFSGLRSFLRRFCSQSPAE